MSRVLPFEHLNLRLNPFGCLPLDQLGALALIELPPIEPGDAWQVIGEKGYGKTTRLLGLKHLYPQAVYEYVPPERPRVKNSPRKVDFLLLDEAQRLSPRQLRRTIRRFSTLVLGTHDDLRPFTERSIGTLIVSGLERERLARMFDLRIESARLGPGRLPRVPDQTLDVLLGRFGDDVRSMEWELYEALQRMEGVGDVQL